VHGVAIALLLAHVVRWNAPVCAARYTELADVGADPRVRSDSESLAQRLEQFAAAGGLGTKLGAAGVRSEDLPALAEAAAQQWTGQFNPRPFDAAGALEIYECAY